MNKKIAIAVLGALSAFGFAAAAQAQDNATGVAPSWTVGAGVGYSKFHNEDLNAPGVSEDDSDTGWKLFAGYHFNRNFAVEGGYVDLGETSATVTIPGGSASEKIEASGPFLDLIGIIPLDNGFSFYGRVGGIYANVKDSFTSAGTGTALLAAAGLPASGSDDKSKLKIKAGLGAQYNFTSGFGVRAEWERYFKLETPSGDKGDVDLFSINGVFSF